MESSVVLFFYFLFLFWISELNNQRMNRIRIWDPKSFSWHFPATQGEERFHSLDRGLTPLGSTQFSCVSIHEKKNAMTPRHSVINGSFGFVGGTCFLFWWMIKYISGIVFESWWQECFGSPVIPFQCIWARHLLILCLVHTKLFGVSTWTKFYTLFLMIPVKRE